MVVITGGRNPKKITPGAVALPPGSHAYVWFSLTRANAADDRYRTEKNEISLQILFFYGACGAIGSREKVSDSGVSEAMERQIRQSQLSFGFT